MLVSPTIFLQYCQFASTSFGFCSPLFHLWKNSGPWYPLIREQRLDILFLVKNQRVYLTKLLFPIVLDCMMANVDFVL